MARAYLDHASSTPARPEALAALTQWAALPGADPGRLHEEGRIVRDALEMARSQVATLVGVTGRQVIFTSGATESINAAVWGATRAAPGLPVLCAAVEHSAVRDASARLAPTEDIGVDGAGRLQVDALRDRLHSDSLPRPALVHCQWANHEVGTLQPVHEMVALCREAGVTVHVDAAAACGHVPTDLAALDADLVSIRRAQARGRARSWSADRATRDPVRSSARRRGSGTGAPGRARSTPRAAGLRRRGGCADRR